MNAALLEHIEAKIINFLRDTKAPNHASQIATRIQETREDTLHAIQRLVQNKTLKAIQDFTFLNSTGETIAYTLTGTSPQPIPFTAPVPPSRLTPRLPRG
jgi:hypothetical protein